jgi:transposase
MEKRMIITYNFRIKDSTTKKHLNKLAGYVNFVWNYCNETSYTAWKTSRKYLSFFDLNFLLAGSSNTVHDRDMNAAINILRFGTELP